MTPSVTDLSVTDFLDSLRWLDGKPLRVEQYRRDIFAAFFDETETTADGVVRPKYNLGLFGRAKKNYKTLDLVIAATWACMLDDIRGSQCFVIANDIDQAGDDLDLLKKLVRANPRVLGDHLVIKQKAIERRDGGGIIEVLPANDIAGAHGKSYRLLGIDEIHGYRNYDVLEALALDPHRADAQQWITSYASIYHKEGVPLHDLCAIGRAGSDPRMLFSWYAADYTTDPSLANAAPEVRANPSMASWPDKGYLAQQQRRLPSHKYRRLHLNLPGAPEGAAYDADVIMQSVERGVTSRRWEPIHRYSAFVDMSGGSSDDAVLAIVHGNVDGVTLDLIQDQGKPAPFDPNAAVVRFVRTLKQWGIKTVTGDRYAGETFKRQFQTQGIKYRVAELSAGDLYEEFEPILNGGRVVLLDVPKLEAQLLGLVWRGARIDHERGEHDDFANAIAGAAVGAATVKERVKAVWGSADSSNPRYAERRALLAAKRQFAQRAGLTFRGMH